MVGFSFVRGEASIVLFVWLLLFSSCVCLFVCFMNVFDRSEIARGVCVAIIHGLFVSFFFVFRIVVRANNNYYPHRTDENKNTLLAFTHPHRANETICTYQQETIVNQNRGTAASWSSRSFLPSSIWPGWRLVLCRFCRSRKNGSLSVSASIFDEK